MKKNAFTFVLIFLAGGVLAQQTECPRIYKVQDTFKNRPRAFVPMVQKWGDYPECG